MDYKRLSRVTDAYGKTVTNSKFRRLMKAAGLEDLDLVKGDGYFYVASDVDDSVYRWHENAIYINSFNQQSPEEWVEDIKRLKAENEKDMVPDESSKERRFRIIAHTEE